ncbi:MAG: alpha/beta fold hydrolase [Anaerolineales bacterium]|nr:alpha/beta fold hydrolase [Anaerolineales bacterium]
MAFVTVNGAEIYYQTYGRKRPGQAPIYLIHGATGTGHSNWNKVAPLLAEDFYVIVPDCRGHGQSTNPNMTYSFRELASDVAGTIRALGFERAHVIGHSNGGNIALVTLVEHPDVIQTCIPQAANAWVSPDLVEKEPPIFDPDFIQRERSLWYEELINLHAPLGENYWRDLVLMTVKEIISEPNYTAADLARVNRPTLMIQGEVDRVNAPYKHGQFIARYIPAAEAWIPKGIAHTVHDEIMTEWLERVRDFIARRGTDASEKLYRYRLEGHQDSRKGIFDPRLNADGVLIGTVLNEEMQAEVLKVLDVPPVENKLKVLITKETPWALINRPLEDVRRKPSILAERVSQARMGESARVIETNGDWSLVRLEHDGYSGWVHSASLHICAGSHVRNFQSQCNVIVSAVLAEARNDEDVLVQRIPFATLAYRVDEKEAVSFLQLPDGRIWKVRSQDLTPLESRPTKNEDGIKRTLDLIQRFCGVPYLWGGRTPYGFDCSGLAGTFYSFMGVTIPRDADQQYLAGEAVEGTPAPGDLLYFGEKNEDDDSVHISHVAVSLGGDLFLHSNGADWGTSYNSFDLASKIYRKWLHENYRGARRFR